MIRVQREDFDVGAEIDRLTRGNTAIGGVASFVGLVRDMGGAKTISAMTLEHYPAMTEKALARIESEARRCTSKKFCSSTCAKACCTSRGVTPPAKAAELR